MPASCIDSGTVLPNYLDRDDDNDRIPDENDPRQYSPYDWLTR